MSRHDARAHWVYRCYDARGRLCYVGSTVDLFARLATHRSVSWWASQIVNVQAQVYPDGITARAIERAAITNEVPRWNSKGKWGGRAAWSRQDWDDYLTTLAAADLTAAVCRHADHVLREYRLNFLSAPDHPVVQHLDAYRRARAQRGAA